MSITRREPLPAIGDQIRKFREAGSITASELARRAKVSPTAVWNWEVNGRIPRPETLENIARALKVTTSQLRSGEPDQGHGASIAEQSSANETVSSILEDAARRLSQVAAVPRDWIRLTLEVVQPTN